MQTTYRDNIRRAIKGLALCAPKRCRGYELPLLPQISRVSTPAGAGTSDLVYTVVDVKTGQTYSATATGNAAEVTLSGNALTALRAHPVLSNLFTFADGGTTDGNPVLIDFTARYADRKYTISAVGGASGASAASTVTETQAAGGSGIEFGQLVVRGSSDGQFGQAVASSTVRDIVGMLYRTDGNHFHLLEGDTDTAVDACRRGWHYDIAEEIECWVYAAEAVTPSSRVYMRVEASGSNAVGEFGDTPAGTAQVATFTPAANMLSYAVKCNVIVNGVAVPLNFEYEPTDGTTTTDDAVDGLEDAAAAAITAAGLTGIAAASTASASTTFTITLTSGYAFGTSPAPFFSSWNLDAEVVAGTVSVDAADADMLDVSSIAKFTSSTTGAGLVRLAVRLQP